MKNVKMNELRELLCSFSKFSDEIRMKIFNGMIQIAQEQEPPVAPSIDVACIWAHFKNIMTGKIKRFTPPTIEECTSYAKVCGYKNPEELAEKFYAHYTSNGWMVGKAPMKDWKIAMRITWKKNEPKNDNTRYYCKNKPTSIGQIKAGF